MNYPKKVELTVENDAQLAILYSCFNVSISEVLVNMRASCNEKIQKMTAYFEKATNQSDATDYITSCWRKVNTIIPNTLSVPKFSILLAALEKSEITEEEVFDEWKEVINKKHGKDNIAKIVVAVAEFKTLVKILEFKNIKNQIQLPSKYFENYPQFYLTAENRLKLTYVDSKNTINTIILRIGDFCNITEFELLLGKMKEAGKRLTQINREEKQLPIPKFSVTKEFSI